MSSVRCQTQSSKQRVGKSIFRMHAMFGTARIKVKAEVAFLGCMPHSTLKTCLNPCMWVGYGLSGTQQAYASTYIPTSSTQIVEYLPTRSDPVQRGLRTKLLQCPDDLDIATQLTKRYVSLACEGGIGVVGGTCIQHQNNH